MRPNRLRNRALPALILLALASCADGAGPTLTAPGEAPSLARNRGELQKVAAPMPSFSLKAVIGREGGSLGVPGYTLTVPRGAVSAPTLFTFASVPSGNVEVHLTATSLDSKVRNDVGAAGFTLPVILSFPCETAGGMPAWSRLVIVRVEADGTFTRMPSTFNPVARVISGRLSSFSQYALATD
jgi:hypothetical protein